MEWPGGAAHYRYCCNKPSNNSDKYEREAGVTNVSLSYDYLARLLPAGSFVAAYKTAAVCASLCSPASAFLVERLWLEPFLFLSRLNTRPLLSFLLPTISLRTRLTRLSSRPVTLITFNTESKTIRPRNSRTLCGA